MKKNQKYLKIYCVYFLVLFLAIGAFIYINYVFASGPSSECTGGIITYSGGKTIHTFTSSGIFTCTSSGDVEALVVGGGGGGGGTIGGGGGAGGLLYNSSFSVTTQAYDVIVGEGGIGALGYNSAGQTGGNGDNSVFSSLTAIGGGGGAGWLGYPSTSGGSGGGGSAGGAGSAGTAGQGYAGGNYQLDHGGGGGGASEVGGSGTGASDSIGGDGLQYDISGTNTYYAGGGGGGVRDTTGYEGGAGGLGGGGQGEDTSTKNPDADGINGTGGGGGGAGYNGANPTVRIGGNGGSGIVIISYSTPPGTIDSTYKYAWGEKIGWISFNVTDGNVEVTDSALTGYAWSEKLGWISLNCSNTSSCGTINYSVINDGAGNLSGYAWGEKTGWISFDPTYSQIIISPSTGEFSGYAWGEKTGWISFNCSNTGSCGTVNYNVKSDWGGSSETASLISSVFDTGVASGTAINTILWQGDKPAGTVVKFQISSSNNSEGPWSYFGPDGSDTTYYSPSNMDIPVQINLQYHNNHRYFRYKVFLETNIAHTQSPRIDDIIINWSE